MNRLAIFAHYDPQNIIDDYVIYYLEQLKKVVDRIIFVSDGDVKDKEILKINHLIFDSICEKHREYDFGSYKRGFQLLTTKHQNEFNQLDELLFVNDSCYCLGSFEKIFEDMKEIECDMWGITDYDPNKEEIILYHIQSYFLAFKKTIFLEDFFKNFIEKITGQPQKKDIIDKYEIGLSQLILKNKKRVFTYLPKQKLSLYISEKKDEILLDLSKIVNNSTKEFIILRSNLFDLVSNYLYSDQFYLINKLGCPILKIELIERTKLNHIILSFFWMYVASFYYPRFPKRLIVNHLSRTREGVKSEISVFKLELKQLIQSIKLRKLFIIKRTKKNNFIIKIMKIPIFNKYFLLRILLGR